MIKFSNNKDNEEYLIMDIHIDGGILLASDILPIFASIELEKMYLNLFSFEREIKKYINKVSFRKDSSLGKWLLNNYDQKNLIYEETGDSRRQNDECIVYENGTYSMKNLTNNIKILKINC